MILLNSFQKSFILEHFLSFLMLALEIEEIFSSFESIKFVFEFDVFLKDLNPYLCSLIDNFQF